MLLTRIVLFKRVHSFFFFFFLVAMYFCYRLDDIYVHCYYVNEAEYLSYKGRLKKTENTFINAFL